MEFIDAEKKINSFLKFGMELGLERIEKLLQLIGNPQDNLKFIHVAGTNGKGSASTLTASILKEAGYKTGLFLSPYITCFRERIQISGEMIPGEELSLILDEIMPIVESMARSNEIITEFELITAIALKYFSDNNCDIVVLEVGLGGRFDATNVIKNPLSSIIMSISLDHTAILGDSIDKIAFQKCGIIKKDGTTIVYPEQQKAAMNVIRTVCKQMDNNLIVPELDEIHTIKADIKGTSFMYKNNTLHLPFIGEHQIKNASVVLKLIEVLNDKKEIKIEDDAINKGFLNVIHPARLELLSEDPIVLLDGAHNPDGANALAKAIKDNLTDKNLVGIVGMLKDKDIETSLKNLLPLFKEVITVTPTNSRALGADELSDIAQKYCNNVVDISDLSQAFYIALEKVSNGGAVIIFGSLYLAGEIRQIALDALERINN